MKESIAQFYKDPNLARSARVRIVPESVISEVGSNGPKYLVSAYVIRGDRERYAGKMVTKQLAEGISSETGSDILEKHQWLKKKGFPLIPTLRHNPGLNLILMTDMTKDGNFTVRDDHSRTNKKALKLSNSRGLTEQLTLLAQEASANPSSVMFLSRDVYALIIDKNSRASVCLMDILRPTFLLFNPDIRQLNQIRLWNLEGVIEFISRYTPMKPAIGIRGRIFLLELKEILFWLSSKK